jgi:diguanylate cyclase (GGDEF)-like protein
MNGELPIEALDQPFGGLSPLTPVLQDLLRDLRRQRAEMAQLNLEMRQKVAQRTDALQRIVGKLRAQATRDVLTGLYNRRMLDQSLDELVQRCAQDKAPLCLLMIDVDDFKLLNDTLGHAAGDSLLRAIGQLIRSSVRQQDLAFRCGGDEFVIVLPQSGRPEGETLSKRLTELVDALSKPLPVPRKPRLSIGISTLTDVQFPAGAQELMQEADRRLYAAKFARKSTDPKGRAA